MMKQGRIVDRGTTAELLTRYNRDDLEDVFLDIARSRSTASAPDAGPAPDRRAERAADAAEADAA